MKRKILFLIFIVGGALLLTNFYYLSKNDQGASLQDIQNSNNETGFIYSFYKDDDLDDLSNAKEKIYGSLYNKSDTDSDGYLDGEEVMNGYDPIKAGSYKLRDRDYLSLSIQYFMWMREVKNIDDPQIKERSLDEFFKQNPQFMKLEEINEQEIYLISEDDKETVARYLSAIEKVGIPEGVASYQEIASNYSEESKELLNDILDKLELSYLDFQAIETPLCAKKIQKNYLTILKEFSSYFQDLQYYQEDPVQINLNTLKASQLIDLAEEAERLKLELYNNYDIR
jgi:hypothetical protein